MPRTLMPVNYLELKATLCRLALPHYVSPWISRSPVTSNLSPSSQEVRDNGTPLYIVMALALIRAVSRFSMVYAQQMLQSNV